MPKGVEQYLKGVDSEVVVPIRGFYQFALSKRLTKDDLNEHSWSVAVRALVNYEKYGSGEKRHETLISYYTAWKELKESEADRGGVA